jgi:LuxR family transcriptional regulator, maltose regulon positive regulatory protein
MVKISRPRIQEVYPRNRLFERLDRMLNSPVVWISSPAGSGKTTLISSYIADRKIPCLWYQVDKGDDDLASFFYYMGLAAKKASSGRRTSLPYLTPEYLHGISAFSLRYFERLYLRLKRPFVLVFDDYNEAFHESHIHEVISGALSRLPEGSNAIILSRNDPPSQFARMLANRTAEILKWDEMKLTADEARGIIELRDNRVCLGETTEKILELSGGWAAVLVLICEAFRKEVIDPRSMRTDNFSEVFDYFASEVFDHLDEKTQDFFLTTSCLPTMTVPMAVALTGNPEAGSILRMMERNNYFIVGHRNPENVYEYHPLYRAFLQTRARKVLSPDVRQATQRRAANLLESSGQAEAAVGLLSGICDWEALVRIILNQAPEMIRQGRHRVLQKWIEDIPEGVRDSNSWLLYWRGMCMLIYVASQSLKFFEKAYKRFVGEKDEIGAMLAASGAVYAIMWEYDDFTRLDDWFFVLNDLALRVKRFSNRETEAHVITSIVMSLRFREISHPASDEWLRRGLELESNPETIIAKMQALLYLLFKELRHIDLRNAYLTLNSIKKLARAGESQPFISVVEKLAEVMYYVVSGHHEKTIRLAREGLEISRKTGVHMHDMWFYNFAVMSHLNIMDINGAQSWLAIAAPVAGSWPNWARALYCLQLTRLSLLQKDLRQAVDHGRLACDYAAKAGTPFSLAATRLTYAVALHKLGMKEEAMKYLSLSRAYADQSGAISVSTMSLLIEAQFCFDRGDEEDALELLRSGLSIAREAGYVFTYMDDPFLIAGMLEKALEAGIEVDFTREIIRRRRLSTEQSPVYIEDWPWAVKIYTFGRFGLLLDGKPVRFTGKVQQMPLKLLRVLIALGGRDVPTGEVACILWPDAEGDLAHQSMEITLHRLRKMLGCQEVINLADKKITLNNRYCWVDTWAFERLLGQADEFRKQNKISRALEKAEKAMKLYRGSPLGSEYEERWAVSAIEKLGSKFLNSSIWLGSQLDAMGEWERAVGHYEKCLEVNDQIEDFYRSLMNCYAKLGKRGAALAVYRRCKKTLSVSLGIAPSAETTAIYKSLMSER